VIIDRKTVNVLLQEEAKSSINQRLLFVNKKRFRFQESFYYTKTMKKKSVNVSIYAFPLVLPISFETF